MAVVPTTNSAATVSLYVGEIHPDVTDGQLFDAFSDFKSLASVRICRDTVTGRSLCYGYVNFISPEDAIRAIEVKNHAEFNGKLLRVMRSNRDPDARKSGIGNLFVKNLSELIDNVALQDAFQKFGDILSCKVATSGDGKSKGYGFVQFDSEESANAAIENLNGSNVGGKQITVAKFVQRSDRVLLNPDVKYTNLYMKNLDQDITEEQLQEKFSVFGKVASLVIVKGDSGTSKGFGFVNFENADDARKATEAMNGTQLGSKVLYVARAQKKAERQQILNRQFEEKRQEQILKYQGSNVYVKNIDDDVSEEELKELFSICGTITSAKLMRDDKGISKGFGFVCFSNPDEAIKAVNSFQGFMFHHKPLYVSIAQRKEDRLAQLQAYYAQQLANIAGSPTSVMPAGYPPLYYTGVVSQLPSRPGLMYQPLGVRPVWRPNNASAPLVRPAFQSSPVPVIPYSPRQNRQNRGRLNGQMHSQNGGHSVLHVPHLMPLKDTSNQQLSGQAKYVPNGYKYEVNKGTGSSSEILGLSSMLSNVAPDQQKQIIGERLYPLVQQHKPELCSKITGMLLEMDNAELLLLLESPESLAAKVEEAVHVLKHSKTTKLSSSQDSLPPSFLSAEVTVN